MSRLTAVHRASLLQATDVVRRRSGNHLFAVRVAGSGSALGGSAQGSFLAAVRLTVCKYKLI